ncbi:MAG: hypothetical protein PHY30_02990 [Candidatus Pacebacteria bacterium]|nr:hypothetical protein [Candidatus Paceibacterota bacterium]
MPKKKRFSISEDFVRIPTKGFLSNADSTLRVSDMPVRFSFRFCSFKKGECITNLEKKELEALYKKFKKFENLTWNQLNQLPREKGITVEKNDNENYENLKNRQPNLSRYFHFRVDGADTPFRVFGGQRDDLYCILFFDPKGKENKH